MAVSAMGDRNNTANEAGNDENGKIGRDPNARADAPTSAPVQRRTESSSATPTRRMRRDSEDVKMMNSSEDDNYDDEDEYDGEEDSRMGQHRGSSSAGNASASLLSGGTAGADEAGQSAHDPTSLTAKAKREKRLALNRASARARRKRKKELIQTLSDEVTELQRRNDVIMAENQRLLAENQNARTVNVTLQARVRELESALDTAQLAILSSSSNRQAGDASESTSMATAARTATRSDAVGTGARSGLVGTAAASAGLSQEAILALIQQQQQQQQREHHRPQDIAQSNLPSVLRQQQQQQQAADPNGRTRTAAGSLYDPTLLSLDPVARRELLASLLAGTTPSTAGAAAGATGAASVLSSSSSLQNQHSAGPGTAGRTNLTGLSNLGIQALWRQNALSELANSSSATSQLQLPHHMYIQGTGNSSASNSFNRHHVTGDAGGGGFPALAAGLRTDSGASTSRSALAAASTAGMSPGSALSMPDILARLAAARSGIGADDGRAGSGTASAATDVELLRLLGIGAPMQSNNANEEKGTSPHRNHDSGSRR